MLKNSKKFSFIIADDDRSDQLQIHQAIQSLDININYTPVYNGKQLLDLLLKRGPFKKKVATQLDAVILDLNMPFEEGLNALRKLKNSTLLKELPIFILYTLTTDDYSTQCRALGIAGLYVKPTTSEGMKNILGEIYSICGGKLSLADSEGSKDL